MYLLQFLVLSWANAEPRLGIDFHQGDEEDQNKTKTPCTTNVPLREEGCEERVCADGFLTGMLVERVSFDCCQQVDYSVDCYEEFPELFPDYLDDEDKKKEDDKVGGVPQECSSYTPFPDGIRRRWDYPLDQGEAVVPDYFLSNADNVWYGAVGVALWTQPPGLGFCGGVFPVWMRGIPPKKGESGSVEVCVQTRDSDCSQTWIVKATNCVTYIIYKLVKAPVQDAVYCTGKPNCVTYTIYKLVKAPVQDAVYCTGKPNCVTYTIYRLVKAPVQDAVYCTGKPNCVTYTIYRLVKAPVQDAVYCTGKPNCVTYTIYRLVKAPVQDAVYCTGKPNCVTYTINRLVKAPVQDAVYCTGKPNCVTYTNYRLVKAPVQDAVYCTGKPNCVTYTIYKLVKAPVQDAVYCTGKPNCVTYTIYKLVKAPVQDAVYCTGKPNCVTYTIYRLVKAPVQDAVYCTGPDDPGVRSSVTLQQPIITIDVVRLQQTSHFIFYCDIDNIDPFYFYQTLWYGNNSRLHTFDTLQPMSDFRQVTALTEDMLVKKGITHIGFTVKCDIRVRKTKQGPAITTIGSEWKLAGVKPATWNLTLSEAETKVLHLDVTAPVDCGASSQCGLHVLVETKATPTCGPPALVEKGCDVWLTAGEGGDLSIRGGELHGAGISQGLTRLTLRTAANHHMAFWRSVVVGEIVVTVAKNQTVTDKKVCMVTAHSHMVTFDGRHYEHHSEGVFTLYGNRLVHTEVQVQFTKCRDTDAAFCPCALAIRAGQTVFRLDGCRGGPWRIQHAFRDSHGDLVEVKRKGSMYIVRLPTDTYLHVSIHHHLLSVWMFPVQSDIRNSGGLCGVLSGDCADDFKHRDGSYNPSSDARVPCQGSNRRNTFPAFTDSWRVSENENLFLETSLEHLQPWGNTSSLHCHCTSATPQHAPACTASTSSFCEHGRRWMDQFTAVLEPVQCPGLEREHHTRVAYTGEGQQIASGQAQTITRNEGEAMALCETLFHRLLKACIVLPGSGIQDSLDNCVFDLQQTNTSDIVKQSMEAAKISCVYALVMNTVLDEQRSDEERRVYEKVMAVTCPFDCNGRGECKNGSCACNSDYGGNDCSVLRSSAPRTFGFRNNGLCDVKKCTCSETSVLAENVIESDDTVCRIQHFTVDLQGLETRVSTTVARARVASVSEVVCSLPTQRRTQSIADVVNGYRVAISNDGITFSEHSTLIVYNSECQACSVDSDSVTCNFTTPSCVADGVCVSRGQLHPGDNCHICDVTHPGSWTRLSNGTCGGSGEDISAEWITAGSITMVTVVFAATCIALCLTLGKKRVGKSVPPSVPYNLGWNGPSRIEIIPLERTQPGV
ncbi:uncharacterized protein LOC124131921 [Haliotis rufescens]|uniref:uncharacterized protein LOC124131921 n=1 Tax=Haliotis rufescens TaxID=6454 RepID=UPI00201F725F|nr:uncharacterized protein LOC124131921 [Haliotis rufescens]